AAAGALWSVAVFRALSVDGAQEALGTAGLAVRVAAVALALLPATLCLGATVPVFGHALAASSVGKRGGLLYALNTLGGAVGIAALGFGLPARIGVTASYLAVSGANALAGVVALAVGDDRAAAPRSATPARPALAPARLRLVAAGSGALGLGLEVLWTRVFARVLDNSVYCAAAGAVLPARWAAFGDREGAARPLGELTAANTLGAVAGAVAAGFVVLPAIGLRAGFLLAAVAYVVLADLVAPAGARLRPLGYA